MFGISIISSKKLRKLRETEKCFCELIEKKDKIIMALSKELKSQQYDRDNRKMHTDPRQ